MWAVTSDQWSLFQEKQHFVFLFFDATFTPNNTEKKKPWSFGDVQTIKKEKSWLLVPYLDKITMWLIQKA
jgi:hypothetical protein